MERADYRQILILIGTTAAIYLSFRYLLPLIIPFLISYLIVILVQPVVVFAKKKWNVSRGVSGGIFVFLLVGVFGTALFGLGKVLVDQVRNVIANFPRYEAMVLNEVGVLCGRCDKLFGMQSGESFQFIRRSMEEGMFHLEESVMPFFSIKTILSAEMMGNISKLFDVFWVTFIVIMGAFLIIKDMEDLKIIFEESCFFHIGKKLFGNMGEVGGAYLRAQFVIMLLSAVICTSGIFLLKIPNSLLWGIGISAFDAFPVLGSGLILIPWSLISLLKGNWYQGAVLFTVYVICQVMRELVEAKILGDKIGIKPVFTLASMYIGTELFGVAGFILGPVGFLLIKNVVKSQY